MAKKKKAEPEIPGMEHLPKEAQKKLDLIVNSYLSVDDLKRKP